MPDLTQDLKDNYDVNYWSGLLDKYDQRLTELHKNIDSSKYTEWALVALKANQGNQEAKLLVSKMLQPSSAEKKIIDGDGSNISYSAHYTPLSFSSFKQGSRATRADGIII